MASNKHAQIRYKVLDDCLSNFRRKFYFDDLLERCNDALSEYYSERSSIKTRTLRADLSYMRDRAGEFGVDIITENDGNGYFYRYSEKDFSIFKNGLSQNDLCQLKETISMLQRFKGMPNLDWMSELVVKFEDRLKLRGVSKSVVGYEENLFYSGLDWFQDLFDAIISKTVLRIQYKTFSEEEFEWTIHPYYLKEYNNRWFLFGLNEEGQSITSLALDRIDDIEQIKGEYKPTDINFETYFDDIIGVTVRSKKKEVIRLKFSKNRFPYIETKAIHPSQKYIDRENCIIEISVIPNNELEALILSFGKDVEVLSPASFRNKIQSLICESYNIYSTVQIDCTTPSELCNDKQS